MFDFCVDDSVRHPVDSSRSDLHLDDASLTQSRSCLQAMVSEYPRGEPFPPLTSELYFGK